MGESTPVDPFLFLLTFSIATSFAASKISADPCHGTRVTVAIGVGMVALARFVEDVPWWGQDSLMT